MKFWVATHWPPREDDESPPSGVWVADGKEEAGKELRKGDCVLIYETSGGPVSLYKQKRGEDERICCREGRQGIVVIAQALEHFGENGDDEPARYVGRKPIWWRWGAETKLISRNGFVSIHELTRALDYSPAYRMRGFGKDHSGLMEITEEQYDEVVMMFRSHSRKTYGERVLSVSRYKNIRQGASRPESEEHKFLKEYVASNPAAVLRERGLRTLNVEFLFDSGDKAESGKAYGLHRETHIESPQQIAALCLCQLVAQTISHLSRKLHEAVRIPLIILE